MKSVSVARRFGWILLAGSAGFVFTSAGAEGVPSRTGAATEHAAATPADPIIDAVIFSGNHKVSSAELLKQSALKPGSRDSVANLDSEIDRIRALYERINAKVSITAYVAQAAKGHVTVTFDIDESAKDPGASHTASSAAETGPAPGIPVPQTARH